MRLGLLLLICCLAVTSCKYPPKLDRDVFTVQATLEDDEPIHVGNSLEWWYTTGWLEDVATGDTFGMEFVIFHFNRTGKTDWLLTNVAVTDPKNDAFYFDHALERQKELLASALPLDLSVASKKCQGALIGQAGSYTVKGTGEHEGIQFGYDLKMRSTTPVVMHGGGTGFEQYGGYAKAGYFSYTDLVAEGAITIGDETKQVKGKLWYDRQWNCGGVLQDRSTGWDWTSISLDQTDDQLMLYRLRRAEGEDAFGGTYIYPDGTYEQLQSSDLFIANQKGWKSPSSKVSYPVGLRIEIPKHQLSLYVEAAVDHQELGIKILPGIKLNYWEGMCTVEGTQNGERITGKAYLELTNPENER